MQSQTTTLLLVEDHLMVRKALKAILNLEPHLQVIGGASDGLEAVQLFKTLNPDIIIMDIGLPKLNGIEASRQILKIDPQAKILILSAFSEDGYIERLTEIGVSGYISKQSAPNLLIDAIHKIAEGDTYFSPDILARKNVLETSAINHLGQLQKKHMQLSEREAQVLQLVAEGSANKQIAHTLDISIKTVEKHRQNLMRKLSIHDTAGLTRYAIAEGYIQCNAKFI
jgi:DNA-binding NarL/FixJ family response regulator